MKDPIVIPLRVERRNLLVLTHGAGVEISGRLSIARGSDGVFELHVEGDGPSPFPARDEPPR